MARRKHEESFKLKVVQEYLSMSVGARVLALRHDLDHETVRRWVQRYKQHGQVELRKKFSHYSAELKLSVLQRMWQEELSFRQAAALFDVRGGHGVVVTGERQYHEGGLDALKPQRRGGPKKMSTPDGSVQRRDRGLRDKRQA